MTDHKESKAYLVGGGIASLAAAAYLIKDARFPGENIYIFDSSKKLGGSLDAQNRPAGEGYVMRGVRMFEEKAYASTFDLFSFIPSLEDPQKTVKEEFFDFNKKVKLHSRSRLVKNKTIIDAGYLGLNWKHRYDLFRVAISPEASLEGLQIKDRFDSSFFETNFWLEICTVFSFQPWHSLVEARRYLFRFVQCLPFVDTLECIQSTPYNQYDSVILPVSEWLKKQGVNFVMDMSVKNLDFSVKNGLLTLLISRWISKPIANMKRVAERFAGGDRYSP